MAIILYQIGIFLSIQIASIYGKYSRNTAIILIAIFTLLQVYTIELMLIQFFTIFISYQLSKKFFPKGQPEIVNNYRKQDIIHKARFQSFNQIIKPESIIIDNITSKDIAHKILRIKKRNKFLFPSEKIGETKKHTLNFSYKKIYYNLVYSIGSSDGKSRSGIIKLDKDLFNALNIQPFDIIKIKKTGNKYDIEKS